MLSRHGAPKSYGAVVTREQRSTSCQILAMVAFDGSIRCCGEEKAELGFEIQESVKHKGILCGIWGDTGLQDTAFGLVP